MFASKIRVVVRLIFTIVIFLICFSLVLAQDNAPLLNNLEIITAQNASHITEIANLGTGTYGLPFWTTDNQTFYFTTTAGTWAYHLNDLAHPQKLLDSEAPQPTYPAYSYPTSDSQIPITSRSDGRYAVYQSISAKDETRVTLEIRDTAAGQTVNHLTADAQITLRAYSGFIIVPKFYGDNLYYLRDNSIYRWSSITHKENLVIEKVADIFISPNGEFAVTNYQLPIVDTEMTFDVYDLRQTPATKIYTQKVAATDRWQSIAFAPDGRSVATGGNGGNVRIWDVESQDFQYIDADLPNESAEEPVVDLAYSDDGRYIAGVVSL